MKALYNDGSVAEVEGDEALHVIRHSAAHIMAQAIRASLYPEDEPRVRAGYRQRLLLRCRPGR